MPFIEVLPENQIYEVEGSNTLLSGAIQNGISLTHACGGHARCSTCRVMILEGSSNLGEPTDAEKLISEKLKFDSNIRLACQTTTTGNVKLRRLILDEEDYLLTKENDSTVLAPVGKEEKIAILFADIRGFTTFSERMPSYDVIHALDRYFHLMGKVIHGHGGYINNYMGDGLMALFEQNISVSPALAAIRSGIEMLQVLEKLKPYLMVLYGKSFEIGIGIHYGEAVLGTVGYGPERRRTAIGDSVNLASRIESMNKVAGTKFLVSEAVFKETEPFVSFGPAFTFPIVGKTGEFKLFEVLSLHSPHEDIQTNLSEEGNRSETT